jgi:putative transposase
VLEDLNVRGMLRNHRLARAIADVGWYEFRRQMSYKGAWYGCQIFLADPYFPSTKRCSCCGHLKADITLSQRQYVCEACGLSIDRDLNAAINLEQLLTATDGIEWMNGSTASSAGSHACGEDVRPGYQATLEEAGTEPGSASCRFV